jgi:hypothetical protein
MIDARDGLVADERSGPIEWAGYADSWRQGDDR